MMPNLPAFMRPREAAPAGPSPEHLELQAIGARLDKLADLLESHIAVHADLPHQVWERLLVEVRAAAQAAALAAWATLRRKVLEEVSKWAWRVALGFAGVKLLEYAHGFIGGLGGMPGVTP